MLRPGGSFIQFTYATRPPVAEAVTDSLELSVDRIGMIVRNVPPATVFRYRRADDVAQIACVEIAR